MAMLVITRGYIYLYHYLLTSGNGWCPCSARGVWCLAGSTALALWEGFSMWSYPGFPHAKPLNSVEVNVTNNWTSQFYFDLLYILEPLFTEIHRVVDLTLLSNSANANVSLGNIIASSVMGAMPRSRSPANNFGRMNASDNDLMNINPTYKVGPQNSDTLGYR